MSPFRLFYAGEHDRGQFSPTQSLSGPFDSPTGNPSSNAPCHYEGSLPSGHTFRHYGPYGRRSFSRRRTFVGSTGRLRVGKLVIYLRFAHARLSTHHPPVERKARAVFEIRVVYRRRVQRTRLTHAASSSLLFYYSEYSAFDSDRPWFFRFRPPATFRPPFTYAAFDENTELSVRSVVGYARTTRRVLCKRVRAWTRITRIHHDDDELASAIVSRYFHRVRFRAFQFG